MRIPSWTITRIEDLTMAPIIQPRYGEDAYAIGRFILDRAKVLGLSRTDLVQRFGYRDLNSGHRALTEFLLTGMVPSFVEKKLAHALEIDQDLIDTLLLATARQIHDEARSQKLANEEVYQAAFRAHLQVQTERPVPSPIFVAALLATKRLRILPLPDNALAADKDARDQVVKATIVEHFRGSAGHVPAFGCIMGYLLVLITGYDGVDFGLPFDMCGDPAGSMREVRRLPEATLGTKRGDTRLTGLLKDTPIEVISTRSTVSR
jgi:hypothetical protein